MTGIGPCSWTLRSTSSSMMLQEEVWLRSLVCLSARFAPGFNSDATARDLSVITSRMRGGICHCCRVQQVRTPSSRGYCAHELTKRSDAGPIPHLVNPTDLNCVDRGQRGELVEVLLTMQTCDSAGPKLRNKWVSVNASRGSYFRRPSTTSLMGLTPRFGM